MKCGRATDIICQHFIRPNHTFMPHAVLFIASIVQSACMQCMNHPTVSYHSLFYFLPTFSPSSLSPALLLFSPFPSHNCWGEYNMLAVLPRLGDAYSFQCGMIVCDLVYWQSTSITGCWNQTAGLLIVAECKQTEIFDSTVVVRYVVIILMRQQTETNANSWMRRLVRCLRTPVVVSRAP